MYSRGFSKSLDKAKEEVKERKKLKLERKKGSSSFSLKKIDLDDNKLEN